MSKSTTIDGLRRHLGPSLDMSDRLLLRLAPDGGLSWLRASAGARAETVAGTPPAEVLAAAGEIVVLVSAEDVLLANAQLAARSRAQLLQALPYAIEDQLLAPAEELHFAAARSVDGHVGVAVVARATLRGWLDRLADAGIRPDVLLPESLALPATPEQSGMLVEHARAIVRLAPWSAFACSLAELPDWLARVHGAASAPLSVHDFRAAPALALPVPIAHYHERRRDPLAWLAGGLAQPPLNLLEGEFAPRHRRARDVHWWRVAAALAAACIVLAFAGLGVDVLRLSRASTRMDTQARDMVRHAFPDVDAAQLARLSPQQLVRGRLERLQGGADSGGLLHVLGDIGPVLAGVTRIQTRGMEYRNGILELALRAPDVAALDGVREQLAMVPGVKAEVTAANSGADGVDGRIRIESGASRGAVP